MQYFVYYCLLRLLTFCQKPTLSARQPAFWAENVRREGVYTFAKTIALLRISVYNFTWSLSTILALQSVLPVDCIV